MNVMILFTPQEKNECVRTCLLGDDNELAGSQEKEIECFPKVC